MVNIIVGICRCIWLCNILTDVHVCLAYMLPCSHNMRTYINVKFQKYVVDSRMLLNLAKAKLSGKTII